MEHSSPIFNSLKINKFLDLVKFITAVFMYKFHKQLLPSVFFPASLLLLGVFINYNTRLASAKSSFALPISRTNYGIFIIKFKGSKTWNSIDDSLKSTSLAVI